jgi:dTDP-4-dehydrorhamnose 3,5-epimerase
VEFAQTSLPGVVLVSPEKHTDDRGFFARTWCAREFESRGLSPSLAQCSISFNARKGTLRGLHYQAEPFAETKVVRCTMGSIYDVVVDLRRESPTFRRWIGVELSATNRRMLYIPAGLAHGFQTLEADTEVFYQISEFYVPEAARGVRWNDPAFAIEWPAGDRIMSDRDRTYADFGA